jgi:hypothetical protein
MTSKNLVVFQHKRSNLREDLLTILKDYPRALQLRDVDEELYRRCHLMPGNELWSTLELYSMWQDGLVYQTVDHTGGVDYDEGYVLVERLPKDDLEFSRRQPQRKGFWIFKLDEQGRRVNVATNEVVEWDQ